MNDDDRPVLKQINLVVRDMMAAVDFYSRLGVEVAATESQWELDHRNVQSPDGLDFDLDSSTFAATWNKGWPSGQAGAVVGFSVVRRDTVDAIYADLTGAGYVGQQPPYDAFWGARYAVVADPDGTSVGIMSAIDPSRRT